LASQDPDRTPSLVTVAEASLGAHTQPVRLDPLAEIERLHHKLAVMYQLGDIVAQALEPYALLQRVIDCVLEVYPQASEAAAILLDEHDRGSLRTVGPRGRASGDPNRSVPLARELVDRIVTHGRAVLLRAAQRSSLPSNEPARITLLDPLRATSAPAGFRMAAPIVFRDEVFGVLHVQADSDQDAFDQADLDLLGGIAGEIAVALRLARSLAHQRVQERIEKDLAIARQIQRNLLPRSPPKVTGLEFDVHYEPAFCVGGDFYDFVWLDAAHLGVVIGDVSGKAVSGALFMARVASEIRAHAALQREPSRILQRVNRAIADTGDDGVFCTALVMSIDIERHVARFSNAGHTLPLIGRDGVWTPIDDEGARGLPLGIAPDFDAGEVEIELRPGDRLLLYTDGLIEASLESGAFYGEPRLREALERADRDARVIHTVLDDVDRFVGGTPQRDDQTLVCVNVIDPWSRRVGSAFPPAR
ncbi:MAG: PP2C family protein-serine/threonine phosphatase, partial [Thermoanaerobaculia bacterium]